MSHLHVVVSNDPRDDRFFENFCGKLAQIYGEKAVATALSGQDDREPSIVLAATVWAVTVFGQKKVSCKPRV